MLRIRHQSDTILRFRLQNILIFKMLEIQLQNIQI